MIDYYKLHGRRVARDLTLLSEMSKGLEKLAEDCEQEEVKMKKESKKINHNETRKEYFNNTGVGLNDKECYICHKTSGTFVLTDTNFTRIFIGEETVLCPTCAKKLKALLDLGIKFAD